MRRDREKRYPIVGQCIRCNAEYFDLRRIMGTCKIDDCGGYITGRTREELDEIRAEVSE